MRTAYTTENGSVYIIDDTAKTWQRSTWTDMSGVLRSQGDPYWEVSCLGVGFPLFIAGPPVNPAAGGRVITTSLVIRIEETPDADLQ